MKARTPQQSCAILCQHSSPALRLCHPTPAQQPRNTRRCYPLCPVTSPLRRLRTPHVALTGSRRPWQAAQPRAQLVPWVNRLSAAPTLSPGLTPQWRAHHASTCQAPQATQGLGCGKIHGAKDKDKALMIRIVTLAYHINAVSNQH